MPRGQPHCKQFRARSAITRLPRGERRTQAVKHFVTGLLTDAELVIAGFLRTGAVLLSRHDVLHGGPPTHHDPSPPIQLDADGYHTAWRHGFFPGLKQFDAAAPGATLQPCGCESANGASEGGEPPLYFADTDD